MNFTKVIFWPILICLKTIELIGSWFPGEVYKLLFRAVKRKFNSRHHNIVIPKIPDILTISISTIDWKRTESEWSRFSNSPPSPPLRFPPSLLKKRNSAPEVSFYFFFFLGLSLELNIERGQYIGGITQEAGVRVDISNQGEMPFPFEKGLSIAPGYATSIGLRKVCLKGTMTAMSYSFY